MATNANVNLGILINAKNNGATGTIDKVTGSVDKLDRAASGAGRGGLASFASALKTGVTVAATAAVGAVGALGAGIVKTTLEAADMEQGIADIAAVMGLAKDETSSLKSLIMNLGIDPKLKVSASEAAGAVEMLARNGLSMDDIMGGAARNTILLANATGADFKMAADIATDAMAIFNIKAEDMQAAVNGITGVTNTSKFGIEDYALALGTGAKGAAAAGISFDQFNQMLTATASNFTSGMTAGTSLTAMMLGLAPRTDKVADAMKELGIITKGGQNRFFDLNGELKSNAEIAEVMRQTLGKLAPEQRMLAVNTIFGRDAMAAVNGMIATTTDSWNGYADALAATDAEQSAATRMDTLRGSIEIFKGVLETLRIAIGDKFVPVFRELVDNATAFLNANGPQLIEWAGGLANRLEGLVMNGLPRFIDYIRQMGEIMQSPNTMALRLRTAVYQTFGPEGSRVFNPFIDTVNTVYRLLSNLFSDRQFYEDDPPWAIALNRIGDSIRDALSQAVTYIKSILPEIGRVFSVVAGIFIGPEKFILRLKSAMYSLFDDETATAINSALVLINNVYRAVAGLFSDQAVFEDDPTWLVMIVRAGDVIRSIVSGLTNDIAGIDSYAGAWALLSSKMSIAISAMVTKLSEWGTALWEWIKDATPKALAKLGEWLKSLASWTVANLPEWTKALITWGASLWEWIGTAIPRAISSFGDYLLAFLGWANNEAQPEMEGKAGEWASALWTWIKDKLIPAIGPALADFGLSMLRALASIQVELVALAAKIAAGIITSIAQGLLNLVGIDTNLDAIRRRMFEQIDSWKATLYEQGANIVKRIGEGIQAFLQSPQDAIRAVISGAANVGTSLMNTLGVDLKAKGSDAVNKLRDGMTSVQNAVKVAATNVFTAIRSGAIDDGIGDFADRTRALAISAVNAVGTGMESARASARSEAKRILKDVEDYGLAEGLGMFAGRLYESARNALFEFAKGMTATSPNIQGDVKAALTKITDSLTSWLGTDTTGAFLQFLQAGQNIMAKIVGGIGSYGVDLSGALSGVVGAVFMWISGTGNELLKNAGELFGSTIVSAIGKAITDGSQALKDALSYLVSILPQWVKDILGIGVGSASVVGASLNTAAGSFTETSQGALSAGAINTTSTNTVNNSQAVYNQFTIAGNQVGDKDTIEQVRMLNMLYAAGAV